jgi:DegV family protein with EDD domain
MADLAIVTDSTADIPPAIAAQYHIHLVPNYVIINGQSLEDGKGISRQEFYERLPQMKPLPTTSTASSGDYEQVYEGLLKNGFKNVLSIHCSSYLSGIYNAARLASEAFDNQVYVFDSHFLTLGLGFQVLAAAELAFVYPVERILELLIEIRKRARVIAMLDTLEYVRRSGRVSWARARIGGLLRIKPFVELREGQVFSLGEARTRRKGIERLMEFARKLGPLERLAILHTNAESDARKFLNELAPQIPTEPLVVNVNTIIGTHVGPNGLGIAALVKAKSSQPEIHW